MLGGGIPSEIESDLRVEQAMAEDLPSRTDRVLSAATDYAPDHDLPLRPRTLQWPESLPRKSQGESLPRKPGKAAEASGAGAEITGNAAEKQHCSELIR
jgi:hypothetical protein